MSVLDKITSMIFREYIRSNMRGVFWVDVKSEAEAIRFFHSQMIKMPKHYTVAIFCIKSQTGPIPVMFCIKHIMTVKLIDEITPRVLHQWIDIMVRDLIDPIIRGQLEKIVLNPISQYNKLGNNRLSKL